eukprot:SAG11_NODE_1320_length_5208_cov_5.188687_7_plen_260_part_00
MSGAGEKMAAVSDDATRELLVSAFSMIEGLRQELSALKDSAPASAPGPAAAKPGSKTVMVSGFFDIMHSGHIKFFNDAATLGAVHVCVGTNANHRLLRGTDPTFSEDERMFMVSNQSAVLHAFLSTGEGECDFETAMDDIKPDIYYVTNRGDTERKRAACETRGISYVVGSEEAEQGLPLQTVARLKASLNMKGSAAKAIPLEDGDLRGFPWRICLAGGWLDQPWVSQITPGPVIVVNVHPHDQFKTRSGLATSTRTYG